MVVLTVIKADGVAAGSCGISVISLAGHKNKEAVA